MHYRACLNGKPNKQTRDCAMVKLFDDYITPRDRVGAADTHPSIRPELINPPAGQQELPL